MLESWDNNIHIEKRIFRLCVHPWLSLLILMLALTFSIYLTDQVIYGIFGFPDDMPVIRFAQQMVFHILTGFVLVPFVLRLPDGKKTFREYLNDIRFTKAQPFAMLMLLSISCSLILALSRPAAFFAYRFFDGYPINGNFIQQIFDLSNLFPSNSPDALFALPSALEEVVFRGVGLTVFLRKYSERKSIIFSSIGFSLIHILNLISGRELEWILGQLVWSFILGLFYGYIFARTKSLMPSMIVHFLSNVTIISLSGHILSQASTEIEFFYQAIISFGIIPTALMILWTRYFTLRWLPG